MTPVPKDEINNRINRLKERLKKKEIDIFFIFQNVDRFYFSGTMLDGLLIVPDEGEPVLEIRRGIERAGKESPISSILPFSLSRLPTVLSERGIANPKRIALEFDVVPSSIYLRIKELFPAAELVDGTPLIFNLRMVKSSYELSQVEKAAGVINRVFYRIPELIKGGDKEIELAAKIETEFLKEGHQGFVRLRRFGQEMHFGGIASGASACLATPFDGPVGVSGLGPASPCSPGEKMIIEGEPIICDLVAGVNGYLVDKTRIFALKGVPEIIQEAQKFAIELNSRIEELLVPGAVCEDIYEKVASLVSSSPYRDNFMGYGKDRVRFVAHGIGLELDEPPVIAPRMKYTLAPGMTLALEPKFFFPGIGAAGVENSYIISEEKPIKLTTTPEDIVVI
jgi:Xaa-Pro dipeptidase